MNSEIMAKTHLLIKRANEKGMLVLLEKGEVVLKVAKAGPVDQELIKVLRENKSHIKEYFDSLGASNIVLGSVPVFEINGEKYYQITPVQLYWLDDRLDSEYKKNDDVHGTGIALFEIEGDIDLVILNKALYALVNRHESLRSAFELIEGKFMMRILESSASGFGLETLDTADRERADGFLQFLDHTFNMADGPLFCVRVVRQPNNRLILALRIHHVIFDGWSDSIIVRDLMSFYNGFRKGIPSLLPELTFQIKEHMYMSNVYSEKFRERDRVYWESLYRNPPPHIHIPGSLKKITQVSEKRVASESFYFTQVIIEKLLFLVGKGGVSLFIVLQATFKSFLFFKTHENDITIGTYIHGRSMAGSENLIGCLASTRVIRTILDKDDTMFTAVAKVKKANDDMLFYSAYTLRDLIEGMLPQNHPAGAAFWQFNIQYKDIQIDLPGSNKAGNEQSSDFQVKRIPWKTNSLIAIDIQIQFYVSQHFLQMEIQYDSSRYTSESINRLVSDYFSYIDKIDFSGKINSPEHI